MKITMKALPVIFFSAIIHVAFSQGKDTVSIKVDKPVSELRIGGAVTVTNKGISTIPNLTLGKPAAIFELSAGKGKSNDYFF